ncbi:MAG: MBL fold metallo-hydrolase [Deltaproteobacteria bacterium]|nr:MBL fold metallo-hydrolase [Deltaproteobacteria bacterium]
MTTDRFNPPDPDELEVSVFGPSKGECIVIHVPNGPWFIVDSFRALNGSRKEPVAVAYLRDVIKTTDVYGLFLTHWHDDHTAGAGDVIRAFASSLKMVGLPDGYGKRELASLMADRLPDSLRSSMIVDIVDVTSALREPASQNIERRTLIAGSVVSPRQGSAWTLEALSPSMDDQADHFATILKFLPSYSGTVPESYDVNSGCAVLHLSVSGMSVMLSSDLDIGSDDDRGWRCIVKHRGGAIASSIVRLATMAALLRITCLLGMP